MDLDGEVLPVTVEQLSSIEPGVTRTRIRVESNTGEAFATRTISMVEGGANAAAEIWWDDGTTNGSLNVYAPVGADIILHMTAEPNELFWQFEDVASGGLSARVRAGDLSETNRLRIGEDIVIWTSSLSQAPGISGYFNMNSGFQARNGINSLSELRAAQAGGGPYYNAAGFHVTSQFTNYDELADAQARFAYVKIQSNELSRWIYEHPRIVAGINLAADATLVAEGVALGSRGGFVTKAGAGALIGLGLNNAEADFNLAFRGEYKDTRLNRLIQGIGASPEDAALIEEFANIGVGGVSILGGRTVLNQRAPGRIQASERYRFHDVETAFLTPEEFSALPRTGSIDPRLIRFSQDSAGANFKPPFGSVDDFADGLADRSIDPASIAPIRIVERNGRIFTLDNRRLYAFQNAGVDVPYQRLDAVPQRELFKFTTNNNGTSIVIRRGN